MNRCWGKVMKILYVQPAQNPQMGKACGSFGLVGIGLSGMGSLVGGLVFGGGMSYGEVGRDFTCNSSPLGL